VNPTRRSLIGAGISIATGATFAGRRPVTSEASNIARIDLERAVQDGFAPGLVGLMAHGDAVQVIPVGRIAMGVR
jgi:hypothetical protein